MRGKVYLSDRRRSKLRITPAYAGKSVLRCTHFQKKKDHPRLCGEKQIILSHFIFLRGSPPPMRGKDGADTKPFASIRITPAYAGKSSRYRLISISSRDHPRLCGEKPHTIRVDQSNAGSPPPMRGKVFLHVMPVQLSGITPAYAGKSSRYRLISISSRDHPRLCGEKPHTIRVDQSNAGSPPPMRGKVFLHVMPVQLSGITPAYAGKSVRSQALPDAVRDHPRLCGEKSNSHFLYSSVIGSPPPMRGKVYFMTERLYTHRITPAYAGKSSVVKKVLSGDLDHPRLCGEKRS